MDCESRALCFLQAGAAALEAPQFQPRQHCRTLVVAQRKVKKTQQVWTTSPQQAPSQPHVSLATDRAHQ